MVFRMGRVDAKEQAEIAPESRLPVQYDDAPAWFTKAQRMGLSRQEFIALLGRHTIEFAGEEKSGFKSRWTQNPYIFDNSYF